MGNGNGIIRHAVEQAMDNLAEKGVDGCDTKDIMLAIFGSLALEGPLATKKDLEEAKAEMCSSYRLWNIRLIGACFSTLLAIIITFIFI